MQQMLNDVLKVCMYGYVKDISHELDPAAKLQNLEMDQNINKNRKKKRIRKINDIISIIKYSI